MIPRNQISGVDDTRPTSASHSSGARTTLPSAPSDENNRNRTPSRAVLVAASSRGFDGKGVNPGPLAGARTCGDNSREILRLDLMVTTLRECLQVERGQVLTDAVIEQRARNGAQALDYALAAFDDDETSPI